MVASAESARPSRATNPALASLEYVVVDCETTGGPAGRGHRITEVCAVRISARGVVLEEFSTLINPDRHIPPGISRLTNINAAMVQDAPRFADVARDVQRILRGRVFVAHNASFDWHFLEVELERAQLEIPPAPVLCTVRLSQKLVPEVRSKSLDSLSYYFGVENEARHRAFGDARATARLLPYLLERASEHDVYHWSELEQLLARRAPRRKKIANPHSVQQVQMDFPAPEPAYDVHPIEDVPVIDLAAVEADAEPSADIYEFGTWTDAGRLAVAETHAAYAPVDATSLAASMPAKRPDALTQALSFLNNLVKSKQNSRDA